MEVVETTAAFRRALDEVRRRGVPVGLVPTMGALHAGHRALVERAAAECGHTVVSIFVNPLQFDRTEDLARYPRDRGADLALCEDAGADVVFSPTEDEMFPGPPATSVAVHGVSERWEGLSRPGHFDGVATVCAKLFSLAGPCRAYFGEKDFQQLLVVRRMVKDLSLPVEVVACPTVREPDGLACSSRNARLAPAERRAAVVLWRALSAGRAAVTGGEVRPGAVAARMREVIGAEPLARLDYAAVVDPADLSVPESLSALPEARLLVAAWFGAVRLIDNAPATPSRAGRSPSEPIAHENAACGGGAGRAEPLSFAGDSTPPWPDGPGRSLAPALRHGRTVGLA